MPSLHYYALPVRPVEEDGWSMASLKIICLIWFVGIFSPSATETRPGWDRKPVVGVCWNIGSIWTLFRNLTRQEIDIDHDEHLLTWAAWQANEDLPRRFLVEWRLKWGLLKFVTEKCLLQSFLGLYSKSCIIWCIHFFFLLLEDQDYFLKSCMFIYMCTIYIYVCPCVRDLFI